MYRQKVPSTPRRKSKISKNRLPRLQTLRLKNRWSLSSVLWGRGCRSCSLLHRVVAVMASKCGRRWWWIEHRSNSTLRRYLRILYFDVDGCVCVFTRGTWDTSHGCGSWDYTAVIVTAISLLVTCWVSDNRRRRRPRIMYSA